MSRFIIFSVIFFLTIVSAGTTTFMLSMKNIIRANKDSELSQTLEMERLKLETFVNSEISIALKMADSPLIKRYFTDPYNKELEKLAFDEIAAYRRAFVAKSVFWVNDIDKIFHSNDFGTSYLVDPSSPENYWYSMTLYETEFYNFNINYNPDLNITNLWINAPVFNENRKPLGIVGTGIEISSFINMVYSSHTGRADIYFFNSAGEITGAGNVALVFSKKNINQELSYTEIDIAANARNLRPGETRILNSSFGKVCIGTLPLIEWYSAAVLPEKIGDYNNIMTVLFLVMLIIMALVFVVFNLFIAGLLKPLRKSMEEAQSASRAKSSFLANMSHEIRTPMNSIVGFSELAMDGETSPKTRDYLSKIQANAEWLLQIINNILDISKIESGKMVLEKVPFDMHELFANCRALIMPKAVEKGIQLYFYAEPSTGKMPLGDPTRLRQIFVNLLSNAVKFTNTGMIKLHAALKERNEQTITMSFEVIDSGIGMTQEQMEKIFDPFTQAESGTTRKYGGTGLGLSITKNIVELMGGKLIVDSSPGIGSKFSFDLTFDTVDVTIDDEIEKKMTLNEIEKPIFEGEVLLCEDSVMNQEVICEHLARVGLRTVIAENGKIGVEMIKNRKQNGEKQFDLVFMDMHMPVMDGLEASAKILEIETNIPIVAMTANIMSSDREIYRMSGMNDCVGKPFTSQELWRCLMKYLTPVSGGTVQKSIQLEAELEYQKEFERMFIKNNRDKYEEIVKALESNNVETAYRLAHSLKGNAGQIGKIRLQQAAADVECQLKNGKNLSSDKQLKILESEFLMVINELSPLLDEEEE
jgi:signal transduction histidine kinase/DNA-binding response OmpR family regulator